MTKIENSKRKVAQQKALKKSETLKTPILGAYFGQSLNKPDPNRQIYIFKRLKSKPVELIIFSYLPMVKAQTLMRSLAHAGIAQSQTLVKSIKDQMRRKDLIPIILSNHGETKRFHEKFQVQNNFITIDFEIILQYSIDKWQDLDAFMELFQSQTYKIRKLTLRFIKSDMGQCFRTFINYKSNIIIKDLHTLKIEDHLRDLGLHIMKFFIITYEN